MIIGSVDKTAETQEQIYVDIRRKKTYNCLIETFYISYISCSILMFSNEYP